MPTFLSAHAIEMFLHCIESIPSLVLGV